MKKEFLLLSALVSCTILFYAVLPNLNVSDNDQNIKTQNNKIKVVNNPNDFDANKINLTFDIVRLDPNGDVIIAGETLPNTEVNIYDGNERLASVFSDSSGDWVWISENPLGPGIKRFALKSFKDGKEFLSDQQVIILREKDNKKMSKIIRFTQNSNIEILNNDSETSSLYLDIVEFDENKSLTVTGRALPNSNIKVFLSENLKTETTSNENGDWSVKFDNLNFLGYDLQITTNIDNQLVKLKTKIFNKKIDPQIFLERQVVVQNGNSLWRIARKTLGGGIFYSEIFKNNIDKITNPNLIFPGQVFNIPNLK